MDQTWVFGSVWCELWQSLGKYKIESVFGATWQSLYSRTRTVFSGKDKGCFLKEEAKPAIGIYSHVNSMTFRLRDSLSPQKKKNYSYMFIKSYNSSNPK
jgi:hypothetical protein